MYVWCIDDFCRVWVVEIGCCDLVILSFDLVEWKVFYGVLEIGVVFFVILDLV